MVTMGDTSNDRADLTGQITETDIYSSVYGGYGDVWQGVWDRNATSIKVAIKVLRTYNQTEEGKVKLNNRLRREVKVWHKSVHKNIVPLFGTILDFPEAPSIGMVSPWMENGNLTEYLRRHTAVTLDTDRRLQLLSDIAAGMHHLHKLNIIHGDLTGGNVLINDANEACLIDFGLSYIRAEFEGTPYWSSTVGGALRWRAPELLPPKDDHQPVLTFKCDIYSFGCVMLQTLSGKVPFSHIKSDLRVAFEKYKGISPARPKNPPIQDAHWDLVSECWGEASTRPSIDDVQASIMTLRA